jgi:hypothetical protein
MKRAIQFVAVFALGALCTLALVDHYLKTSFEQLNELSGGIAIFDHNAVVLPDGGTVASVQMLRPPSEAIAGLTRLSASPKDGAARGASPRSVDAAAPAAVGWAPPPAAPTGIALEKARPLIVVTPVAWSSDRLAAGRNDPSPEVIIQGVVNWAGAKPGSDLESMGSVPDCGDPLPQNHLLVDSNGRLAEAVVRLGSGRRSSSTSDEVPSPANVTVTTRRCRFEPHIQIVEATRHGSGELTVVNDDARTRDIAGYGHLAAMEPLHEFTRLLGGLGESFTVPIHPQGVLELRDNGFPANQGYVVFGGPNNVALTGRDGSFEFHLKPDSRYRQAAHATLVVIQVEHFDPDAQQEIDVPAPWGFDQQVSVTLK